MTHSNLLKKQNNLWVKREIHISPPPRWRRDNWEIKLMELPNEHYSLVGGNLIINNPEEKKHAGTYVCVAKNVYGTVISKEAKVKFGCEYCREP